MKRLATEVLLLIILTTLKANAQTPTTCEIPTIVTACAENSPIRSTPYVSGVLNDEHGTPIVYAYVECTSKGVIKARELTDFDGLYSLKDLSAGTFDITFKFQGKELQVVGIRLGPYDHRDINAVMRTDIPSETTRRFRIGCSFFRYINPQHPGSSITHSGNMLW